MGNNYLIIDITEEVGLHILGHIEDEILKLEEIHRFDTGLSDKDGVKCCNLEHLFMEIKSGLIKCREIGKLPIFVGVAAWGSDIVLMDNEGKLISDTKTGHNTFNRLKTIQDKYPDYLDKADSLMMIPDYFQFLLTGKKRCEFSNAIPLKLVDWETKDWDEDLIQIQGLPRRIFPAISQPGSILGNLTREVTEEIGYDCIIVQPASRKVGSVILKNPGEKQTYNIDSELKVAVGNLLILMISSHEFKDLQAARECLRRTFEVA